MALRKKVSYFGLKDLPYDIVDTDPLSLDFFRIVDFPDNFQAGKNLFKIRAHPTNFVDGAEIYIEILDYNGSPVYYEPLRYREADGTRVISVYIYPDTSPGPAVVYLASRAKINPETGEQYEVLVPLSGRDASLDAEGVEKKRKEMQKKYDNLEKELDFLGISQDDAHDNDIVERDEMGDDEVYNKDGYLGAVGGALEYLTEIHYLERKLNVSYRFDKFFKGSSVNTNGKVVNNQLTYFCRDLEADYSVSFVQLKEDIRLEGLVKTWKLEEYNLKIEVVKIQELYVFIKEKLLNNPKYLWRKIQNE